MLGPAQVNRGHTILKARRIGGQIYREPLAITGTDPGSPHRAAATEAYRSTAGPRARRRQDPRRGDLPGAGLYQTGVYKWQANPVSQRDWDDAHLINAALDIPADDPAFGYQFIADELREQGSSAGENRVARLCSQQRI
jgi:hypothetical protein